VCRRGTCQCGTNRGEEGTTARRSSPRSRTEMARRGGGASQQQQADAAIRQTHDALKCQRTRLFQA